MKVGIKRPAKRLHTGQWKALCGVLVMVSAISLVWAILASATLMQRERDMDNMSEELNDLREDLRRWEEREAADAQADPLLDEYLDDIVPPDADDPDIDPFALFDDDDIPPPPEDLDEDVDIEPPTDED